jgi:uncharacterized MAPEG superfamily protein
MTIAFWCVLLAALLPYAAFSFVGRLDGKNPRSSAKILEGAQARAYAAHQNAFEAFPPFAAAVIISHLTLGPNTISNVLAIIFILARAAHLYFYIADQQPPRSGSFLAGAIVIVAMFIHAAWG